MWIQNGVPDEEKWRNVCRCIDKLEKVISAILKLKKPITHLLFLFLSLALSLAIMIWWGHFHPILLRGALVVAVMPAHKACTQYSHVCFTRPRCETCEHPIQRALVSFLPSPQNLHSVESWTVEKEDSDVCVSVWRVLLLMGDSDSDVLGSIELVDGTSSFCWGPSWTLIFPWNLSHRE